MYEETKMDLGSLLGLAIILYGLCLMYANVPDFVNSSIILSTEILFKSGISKFLTSSPLLSIITCKIFLFSPLTICLIFPLTGETILMFSSFLSKPCEFSKKLQTLQTLLIDNSRTNKRNLLKI